MVTAFIIAGSQTILGQRQETRGVQHLHRYSGKLHLCIKRTLTILIRDWSRLSGNQMAKTFGPKVV